MNDIERRAPGVLSVMKDITSHAQFPEGLKSGNSYEVLHETMGGDTDDYITASYGIPSVTSEIGNPNQFINDFVIRSKEDAYEIVSQNSKWLDYVFDNLSRYNHMVQAAQLKAFVEWVSKKYLRKFIIIFEICFIIP